ncbi:MAG: tRNA (guanine(10)-N(2))-dimethyltransferase [Promethearchaeota archaeon]
MEEKDLIIKREGLANFYIYNIDNSLIPSKSMNVFYNEKMVINRDITNLAINAYNKLYNPVLISIVDSMAASGIGSIRILKECKKIKKIYINDINPMAVALIKRNINLNKLEKLKIQIEVSRKDANFLFSEIAQANLFDLNKKNEKPDVIIIDPFGTPNNYIDSAFKAIRKVNGLLCITATDTPVLFGIKPKACLRKYMSKALHNEYCKETGARILIYFISRMANINNLGIYPLLTFYSNHFIRVFALTFKSKERILKYIRNFGYIVHCQQCGFRSISSNNLFKNPQKCPQCKFNHKMDYAGPLWLGNLHDTKFLEELIISNATFKFKTKKRLDKLLNLALSENNMPITYYNIHKLSEKLKLPFIPKVESIIKKIKESGYEVSRTHFDFLSIKTNMDIELIKNILLDLQKKEI